MSTKNSKMPGRYINIMEHAWLKDDERLPEEQWRCMLYNIRREDFVYAESGSQHGIVKQIIRDCSGIPVCLGILTRSGCLDFVSVDRISRWTHKGPPDEWVAPYRFRQEYFNNENIFTYEDYYIGCREASFYEYEMPCSLDQNADEEDDEEVYSITFSIHEEWEDKFWEGKEDESWDDEEEDVEE